MTRNTDLNILLANPRGFCAGVRRAIEIVEKALKEFGAPIYVRHEIVHNKHVIAALKEKGAVFVNSLDDIEDTSRPVVFSAHGVSNFVKQRAAELGLKTIDATCPLVSRVHRQIAALEKKDSEIIVIGKANHAEIIGTIGQMESPYRARVINSPEEAKALNLPRKTEIGFVTQTTLSVDDTKEIIDYLRKTYPNLEAMKKDDICFATTNRQKAVKKIAPQVDLLIVIGSKNSSNSKQLKDVALKNGAKNAILIDDVSELEAGVLDNVKNVGITAGASAPEHLVKDLICKLKESYDIININNVIVAEENVAFKL